MAGVRDVLYAEEVIFCAEHLVGCPRGGAKVDAAPASVAAASMGLPVVLLTGEQGGCDGVGAISLPVVAISSADINGCLAVAGGKLLGHLTVRRYPPFKSQRFPLVLCLQISLPVCLPLTVHPF